MGCQEAVTQSETSNKPKRKVEGKEHQKVSRSPVFNHSDSEDEPRYTSTSEGPVTSKKAKGFTMHSFVASDRPKAAPKALEVSHRLVNHSWSEGSVHLTPSTRDLTK
ncbi:hypothetical protein AG1IA_06418 [Rhizoctonia solani AG-1 IA]|uniref:Uncharacterized protein n=1 Tax=Thanatephorus cucumeris (strain AG1-IA) TaxID=983506 RepID=L8WS33_THACA|nr:hypothetical protein AG1IA_06418 [Rhizoctonia solani AG-1 IA]